MSWKSHVPSEQGRNSRMENPSNSVGRFAWFPPMLQKLPSGMKAPDEQKVLVFTFSGRWNPEVRFSSSPYAATGGDAFQSRAKNPFLRSERSVMTIVFKCVWLTWMPEICHKKKGKKEGRTQVSILCY